MARPLIAVTGPRRGAWGPRACVALGIWLAGGRPVQIRPGNPMTSEHWQGVVISGGHDIDPVLYAAEPEVRPRYDRDRDTFESMVIDQALARRLPLLGICRGAQLLNVRLGGDLFQELRSQRQYTSNRRTLLPLKTLQIVPVSRLARWLAIRHCRINSLHNQAINRLGRGLRIAGRDLDGIVQAIEHPDSPFLLGVQWHPEFLLPWSHQRRLFKHLVQAAQSSDPGASGSGAPASQ